MALRITSIAIGGVDGKPQDGGEIDSRPPAAAADWTSVTVVLKTGQVIVFIRSETDAAPRLDSLLARWCGGPQ